MSKSKIRIGGASAAWGDTIHGARQLVERGNLDYLVGDFLAEVTMAILARMRAKSPEGGFIPDWLAAVRPLLPRIHADGVRLITNSGGMNPLAARDAFAAMAGEAGLDFRVAAITGDDLTGMMDELRAAAPAEMFSGAALPERLASVNAYLGAVAIARALDAGADVVITGRVVDSALVLGPLMHEFGWGPEDYDRLAGGSLAGHVIECGAQGTGGLFTDWEDVAEGWDDMGFPIVECGPDGDFTVTRPEGTGGLVTPATVGEQIVYEIGDPAAYLLPDVTCDFRDLRLVQDGPGRVAVSGVRGRAPGPDYKVCATHMDGFRLINTYMLAGGDAGARGRAMAQALVRRSSRLMAEQGFADFEEVSIEVIGAEDTYGAEARDFVAREVLVKIGLRHRDARALEVFAREFATPAVSMAQGVTGAASGRPKPAPVLRVHSFLWPKAKTPVLLHMDGEAKAVEIPQGGAPGQAPALPDMPVRDVPADAPRVSLRALAWARSGDKGDHANIGILARQPDFAAVFKGQLTADRVAAAFAHYLKGGVTRYEMPGMDGFNFVLENVLNGGGSASLRYDPQAKTYGQMLLDIPIRVPAEWLAQGGPLA
ncbi:MAG: DUF1446 domain-containing protein, partial [Rhodobacteraceae bacterium]|nr:DUF1446 domain-containing protein [Paracoccaceae bacterium]